MGGLAEELWPPECYAASADEGGVRKGTNGVIVVIGVIAVMVVIVVIAIVRFTRKGTNWVSTNGATANSVFFDRGTVWVLPLTYFYIPKSARAYLFPQSAKIHYFCSWPHQC